ncbi:MAG: polysaccharide deacetylase family protein [Micavibrio sp.]|nr:polysaccharide deacetylase family protein [Micavibrio sp.]
MAGSLEIAMLHRVMPEQLSADDPYRYITLTSDEFEDYLKSRKDWRALSLEELVNDAPQDENVFAVTFDDGYMDNKIHALPLLEKYNVPATIFCGVDFIEGRLEPFESLLGKMLRSTDLSAEQQGAEYRKVFRPLKRGSVKARMANLEELATHYGVPAPKVNGEDFMRWEDVIEIDKHPLITIGSHVCSHTVLWRNNPLFIWHELKHSKNVLEEKLGRRVDLVSYPYGRHDMLVRSLARLAGYKLGCSTTTKVKDNILALPRRDLNAYEAF